MVAFALVLILFAFSSSDPKIRVVYAADIYGNDFEYVEVWQYNSTDWVLIKNFTVSGDSAKISHNQMTKFVVMVRLNDTLATSTSQAVQYTKIYMNITYDSTSVWNNVELNNTSCSSSGGFYHIKEWGNWTADLPIEGESYLCELDYQHYY